MYTVFGIYCEPRHPNEVTVSFGLCVVYLQTYMHPLLNSKDNVIIMVVIKSHNINVISIIQAII